MEVFDRQKISAMHIKAFRGELGMKVRYHAPQVYGLGPGHVIEIEPGDEALYPLAETYVLVHPADDDDRRGPPRYRLGPEEFFRPHPHRVQDVPSHPIVICPRQRAYGSAKNWPHWGTLSATLMTMGIPTFAAGTPESSDTAILPDMAAWDFAFHLDATIEAMAKADLVIATASGLSLLAVMIGVPLLLIHSGGRVAPGPQMDAEGRILSNSYGRLPMQKLYEPVNHLGSPIWKVDAWEDPHLVYSTARGLLKEERTLC